MFADSLGKPGSREPGLRRRLAMTGKAEDAARLDVYLGAV